MLTIHQDIFRSSKLSIFLICKSDNSFDFKTRGGKGGGNSYGILSYSTFLIFKYLTSSAKGSEPGTAPERVEVAFSVPHMYSIKKAFAAVASRIERGGVYETVEDPEFGTLVGVAEKYSNFRQLAKGAGKSIMLEFEVKEDDATNTFEEGVIITVGNEECRVFLNVDIFMSLDLAIQEFNLFASSQNLVSMYSSNRSLKMRRSTRDIPEEEG